MMMMKSLKRNDKGELILTESETVQPPEKNETWIINAVPESEVSPVVTNSNFPAQVVTTTRAKKSDLSASLMTEAQLLAKMKEAGGQSLTTQQFAVLITPHVRNSVDPIAYQKWDIALTHVRALARSLADKGLIRMVVDNSDKRLRYLYSIA